MYLNQNESWMINGVKQFVAMRAEKPDLPLLLYLHGGPGDAALPLVLKFNGGLAKHFTVAIWEQRGTGKSYYKFEAHDNICVNTFVQDAQTLIQMLLQKFGQRKVYLVGHSWGSILGLMLCQHCPELIQIYVGCGQVVDMKQSCRCAYDFAWNHASEQERRRLEMINPSYLAGESKDWLQDLLFTTKLVVKYKGSLYGASNYNKLIIPFLNSKEYSLKNLLERQKGSLQSIQALWQEVMTVSFTDISAYNVPVVFVEGKFDFHVSSELVKNYYDTIVSEKQFYLFENSCHFPQWSEALLFHRVMASLIL